MTATTTAKPAAQTPPAAFVAAPRWSIEALVALFELPFNDLLFRAQEVHRERHDANAVQRSTLLSIKTGGCSEDCGYCSQSAHHGEAQREALLETDEVVAAAQAAKDKGATRFCMGAAWRGPKDKDLDRVTDMIGAVKALGLETCVTLGMLKDGQAERLKEAGLDYYNHNLDTAPEFYGEVIKTHAQSERFDTIDKVREAGIKVCCGGIVGMGETRRQRASLLVELANMNPPPESVPIDELQALCFLAGANSIFYGDKLLTAGNPEADRDEALFARLGLRAA